MVLGKTLESPLDCKEIQPVYSKEISPEYSLEVLILKLKLQYFGHLMWRTDLLEKTLMLGKIEGGRKMERQRMRWLDGITDSMDISLSWWWTGKSGVQQSRVPKSQTQLSDWTELNDILSYHREGWWDIKIISTLLRDRVWWRQMGEKPGMRLVGARSISLCSAEIFQQGKHQETREGLESLVGWQSEAQKGAGSSFPERNYCKKQLARLQSWSQPGCL